jgi:hypothetical protein
MKSAIAPKKPATEFTAQYQSDRLISAPTTFTKLGSVKHAYPLFVQNTAAVNRYFRFTIVSGADIASFDQFSNAPAADVIQNGIFAYSSFSAMVYVEPDATGTVKVNVEELSCAGAGSAQVCTPTGSGGAATINLDPTNTVPVTFEAHNPLVPNPLVPNPLVPNPLVPNPLVPNPLVPNPLVPNPLVPNITASNSVLLDPATTIYTVQYGTTSFTNVGNTTTTFAPDVKIDNPSQYDGEYVFQLVVYKTAASAAFNGCSTSNAPGFQILASVPMTSAMLNPLVPNPLVPNPLVPNPLVPNPLVPNPLVPNATVTVAPTDAGTGTSSAVSTLSATLAASTSASDGTLRAPRLPDEVHVALFAYQIVANPTHVFNPSPAADGGDPPSIRVYSTTCNSDGTCPSDYRAPDLVASGTPTVSPASLARGSVVGISFTLANQGNADANSERHAYTHRAFLSADTSLDAGDIDLGIFATSTGVLHPGDTALLSGTTPGTIPSNAPLGPQYLLVFVDSGREVSEVNESNNVTAVPVVVLGPSVTTIGAITPSAPVYGNQFTVAASNNSGAVITFSWVSGPCSAVNPTVGTFLATGVGTCTVRAVSAQTSSYLGSSADTSVTIGRRPASVTPNPATKSVGAADPILTGTPSGFVPGDNVTAAYSRTPGETVGSYTISATLSPSAALVNYLVTYNTAVFTIVAAPAVTATASPTTLLWSPNKLMVPVTVSGLATGAGVSSVTYTVKDEYGQVQPTGSAPVSNGAYSFVVKLEAYRNGSDADGRFYTVTVTVKDVYNQVAQAVAVVRVPHDQK